MEKLKSKKVFIITVSENENDELKTNVESTFTNNYELIGHLEIALEKIKEFVKKPIKNQD
jgi:ATP-dependent 26S proteasome regulatory subunit